MSCNNLEDNETSELDLVQDLTDILWSFTGFRFEAFCHNWMHEPGKCVLVVFVASRPLAVDPFAGIFKGLRAGNEGHNVHAEGEVLRLQCRL